jgi:uncharacterized membrane protein YgcG
MAALQKKQYETAWKDGYFASQPEAARSGWGCAGIGLLGLALVGGFFALGAFSTSASTILCPFAGLAVTAIGLMVLAPHMPAKTRKGSEAAALAGAFRNYLTNLEKYTDPAKVTEQFEKYLPWAIAFGLDRTWINRFQRIPSTPMPGWYFPVGYPYHPGRTYPTTGTMGTGGIGEGRPTTVGEAPSMPSLQQMSEGLSGSLQGMSEGLSTMLNSASRTLTSTPPPANTSRGGRSFSGGSRSFGGGRSGGGFRSSGGSGGGRRGFR